MCINFIEKFLKTINLNVRFPKAGLKACYNQ